MLPRLENARRWAPRDVDRALWCICAANALGALWLSQQAGDLRLAALVVAAALGLGGLLAWRLAGTLVCTLTLVTAQVALVALQIHLTRGTLEAHFNVFVSMSLLLAYRDWRPVVAMAGLFTLHHVVFDRLLLAGYGTYCLSEPDLQRVAVHAGFVVGQAITLSCVATVLRRESREGRELEALVSAMGRDGPIQLDVGGIQASTAAGQRLQQVQKRMAESMRLVRNASRAVCAAAQQMIVDSGDLMQRTEATASELQDAAVCLDQIGIIVQHSSEASAEAKALSEQASGIAAQGNAVVRDVVRTMGDIDGSSRRIADIVGLIDGLAFQTNILALNAAVEAARAGEQGRGFAVVASEVRSLAQRSAAASREIRQLVDASTSTVGEGAQLVTGAGDTMNQLTEAVQRVGTVFQNIAADADAHAEGLQSVSQSMVALRQTTQHNLAVAERSTATARSLQELVGRMGEVVDVFQLGAPAQPAASEASPVQASKPAFKAAAAAPNASAAQSTVDFF